MSSSHRPSRWPADVVYISCNRYAASLPPDLQRQLRGNRIDTKAVRLYPHVTIREITTAGHPAFGERGLFATRKIPAHSHILDYYGEVHSDERNNSDYDLSLWRAEDGTSVGIDAQRMGNEARFINDYRGIRDKPNAFFKDGRSPEGELGMSIWSGKEGIKKGDEIVVSYGKGWWNARIRSNGEGSEVS